MPGGQTGTAHRHLRRLRWLPKVYTSPPLTNLSASIGIATFPLHAPSRAKLTLAADAALYTAKRGGRNRQIEDCGLEEGGECCDAKHEAGGGAAQALGQSSGEGPDIAQARAFLASAK